MANAGVGSHPLSRGTQKRNQVGGEVAPVECEALAG